MTLRKYDRVSTICALFEWLLSPPYQKSRVEKENMGAASTKKRLERNVPRESVLFVIAASCSANSLVSLDLS